MSPEGCVAREAKQRPQRCRARRSQQPAPSCFPLEAVQRRAPPIQRRAAPRARGGGVCSGLVGIAARGGGGAARLPRRGARPSSLVRLVPRPCGLQRPCCLAPRPGRAPPVCACSPITRTSSTRGLARCWVLAPHGVLVPPTLLFCASPRTTPHQSCCVLPPQRVGAWRGRGRGQRRAGRRGGSHGGGGRLEILARTG